MKGKICLKRGTLREKPLRNHHPWIFSGAIARVENANDGDTVEVYDAAGEWLARASYNSRSQIAARVWTFEREEKIDREFFKRRLRRALEIRESVGVNSRSPLRAFRWVNAESDGLPGIFIDSYADFIVAQFLTLGAELHKKEVVESLLEIFDSARVDTPPSEGGAGGGLRGIYERGDVDVRKKEGLQAVTGVLYGAEPPDKIEIEENGLRFLVDVKRGHKTGFYLDQRLNRRRAAPYLRGEVLNAFAYTGGFGIYAAQNPDTRVVNLDASASSLDLARENFSLNGMDARAEFLVADAFQKLREFRAEGRRFDSIVLDPPKFASSQAQLERALRGYKDINLLAFQLLRPGGTLVTFSCSGLVSADLFQKVIFGAARDAAREGLIVEKLLQAPDHPISLAFPESEYLKGLIVRVL